MSALSALESRDYEMFVEALAEPGFDVEAEHGEELPKSLMLLALEEAEGEDKFVKALMSAGARPDIRNPVLEIVPFHLAVRKHDPSLLKLLVPGVRDINIQDGDGSTALHRAAEELSDADEEGREKLLECLGLLLLVPGLEINAEDLRSETTALHYAAMAGSEKAVDLLLSYGASCGEETRQEIKENIENFDPVKFSQARPGRPVKNILFNMIELGDNVAGLATYLTDRTVVDWDWDNGLFTLLQYACDQGRDGIVAYLLQQGARYDQATNTLTRDQGCFSLCGL